MTTDAPVSALREVFTRRMEVVAKRIEFMSQTHELLIMTYYHFMQNSGEHLAPGVGRAFENGYGIEHDVTPAIE
ncbi:MAG: hypothetical protein Q9185_001120 [Variospora sp. 1 TL-2023]